MDNVYLRVNTCVRLQKESFVSDVCIDLKKRQKEFIIDLNCCIHRSDVSRFHYADANGTTYYCIVKKMTMINLLSWFTNVQVEVSIRPHMWFFLRHDLESGSDARSQHRPKIRIYRPRVPQATNQPPCGDTLERFAQGQEFGPRAAVQFYSLVYNVMPYFLLFKIKCVFMEFSTF